MAVNFENALKALEEVVHSLERGDLPLDKALAAFEKGVKLSQQCEERLAFAERRIEELTTSPAPEEME